jgi:hypothetical protein
MYILSETKSLRSQVVDDDIGNSMPTDFVLKQNYPNPFTPKQ